MVTRPRPGTAPCSITTAGASVSSGAAVVDWSRQKRQKGSHPPLPKEVEWLLLLPVKAADSFFLRKLTARVFLLSSRRTNTARDLGRSDTSGTEFCRICGTDTPAMGGVDLLIM